MKARIENYPRIAPAQSRALYQIQQEVWMHHALPVWPAVPLPVLTQVQEK